MLFKMKTEKFDTVGRNARGLFYNRLNRFTSTVVAIAVLLSAVGTMIVGLSTNLIIVCIGALLVQNPFFAED